MRPLSRSAAIAALCLLLSTGAASILAAAAGPAAAAPADGNLIELNFPQTVELQTLIEYVSKRLGVNILYDENIGKTRVSLSSPAKIDKDALLPLLQSVLEMANMELVEGGPPGWKMVGRKATVRFVTVKHSDATELARQVSALLEERERIAAGTGGGGPSAIPRTRPAAATAMRGSQATLIPDARTNQIAIVASDAAGAETQALIESLDVPADMETRTYRLRYVAPERIDNMVRGRLAAMGRKFEYNPTMDEASGLLLVTAPLLVHEEIDGLIRELDVENDPNRSYVRFYKLINTTASDVLATLRSLQEDGAHAATGAPLSAQHMSPFNKQYSGPNRPPQAAGMPPPLPPIYHAEDGAAGDANGAAAPPVGGPAAENVRASAQAQSYTAATALAAEAVVTSDANTNSIIVMAPPEIQRVYEELIRALDKRRPQVLVEITLVALNTSGNFSLGVDLSAANFTSAGQTLVFSSFGLSKMNLTTGVPTLTPGPGFNGIVVGGDTLSAVVRALASNSRSKVLSAPRVLVNDNATATLASVAEAPFTSVNASSTVSTTSFGGYATAGTTVTVSPHISEGEHLQLQYTITVNNFTDSGADGVPPPRITDSINSEVTVPNGSAVIVGGLKRTNLARSFTHVPLLGSIPLLKYLFGLQSNSDSEETLFVFIRPIILRDDKFGDLRYLSERDLASARLPANAPSSAPRIME